MISLSLLLLSAGCCHGWIHKRSPYPLGSPPGCCHGKVQSDLFNPSLSQSIRAPSAMAPLASFEATGSLVVGFLFLFFSLDKVLLFFRLPPSTPPLADEAPSSSSDLQLHLSMLLHWLGCWSDTFHVSFIMWSGWASLHSKEVLLRGF